MKNRDAAYMFVMSLTAACMGISMLFSIFRVMGEPSRKGPPTCEKLNFDRLEPAISSRWFCAIEEKQK